MRSTNLLLLLGLLLPLQLLGHVPIRLGSQRQHLQRITYSRKILPWQQVL